MASFDAGHSKSFATYPGSTREATSRRYRFITAHHEGSSEAVLLPPDAALTALIPFPFFLLSFGDDLRSLCCGFVQRW